MYHLTKNGTRGYCRAIIRPCPLGGESAFFKKTGIQGAARPSAPEAKEMGMYDKLYGKEKTRQERIKERRLEKEAARAAESNTQNNTTYTVYSAEYMEKLSETKNTINSFNEKHSDFLDNSSGYYFMANQRLSYSEQEYLNDLDEVGGNISTLVNEKIKDNKQMTEDRKSYETELKIAEDEKKEYIAGHKSRIAVIEEGFSRNDYQYGEYARLFNLEVKESRKGLKEHQQKINDVNSKYSVKYESTYGKIYKETLSDIGVDFSNGEESFEKKVYNQNSVSEDFETEMKSAMSYYPSDWVDNIESSLYVHKYGGSDSQLGSVKHKQGRYYERTNKRVDLYSSGYTTTIHEFGHVLEINNPEIGRAERLFLIQEKQNSSYKKVKKVSSYQNCATDSLVSEYSGVYYSGGSSKNDTYDGNTYEIFTTGVENLFAADTGGFTTDENCKAPQHRNFILGLFATTVRK